ncbi:MAG: sigma-70 family RNA polymerase sigma factor [Chloroflexota bacterium]
MYEGVGSSASLADAPDDMLVRAMAAQDPHALDALYTRHGPGLLGYLSGQLGNNRQLAEEVLQDVMLAAWKSAPNFRGDSKVRTWLIAIARNLAINVRRKRKVQVVELHDVYKEESTSPLERLERMDRAEALKAALRELPDSQRETLELVFFHQLSGPEVAEVLDISVGTVKSRLHRAKETLRGLLGDEVGL